MPVDILLGLQWGDEGKGKVVDYLAPNYDIIARFQGGPNAGHTLVIEGKKHVLHSLVIEGKKHVLHQIPSGIFHPRVLNVVGNGVVLDPIILEREIRTLLDTGMKLDGQLVFSDKAHLITPGHRHLDAASEKAKGVSKIGSTLKGIGPCYQDKYARSGIMMGLLNNTGALMKAYDTQVDYHLRWLKSYDYVAEELLGKEKESFLKACEFLKQFEIVNTEKLLNEALAQGKNILAEGAQGTLLDIEFGTYPFVTSSHTVSAGACVGLGVPPKAVRKVFGIFKAYCTRVGSGPFPSELFDKKGEEIRQKGAEFGSTTGRPRRCGWLDLEMLNYANQLNGTDEMMMMKSDVLDEFDEVIVRKGSDAKGNALEEKLSGWGDSSSSASYEDLPLGLRDYVSYIEEATGVPITMVSIGPDRAQTILK